MIKRILLSMLAFLFISLTANAQQVSINGIVTGEDGEGLPGATVMVKGTSNGVTTNADGAYFITVEGVESPVLVISYIGYLSEEIAVDNQTEINVTMSLDMQSLDEIVVVGYGTQKKSLVTGAISKVSSEELQKTPALRVEQALIGKAAGVYIANMEGSPGGGLSVRIRGTGTNSNSDPLYIVDGMSTGGIEFLNPGDIESIEILKDAASAAIYGAEAANGVVLITTKSGKIGGESTVSYEFYYGVQNPWKKIEVLDAEGYITAQREMWRNAGGNMSSLNELLADSTDYEFNTNWLDQVTRKNAPFQNHQLSITGGNEKMHYSTSLNYYDQDGMIGDGRSNFRRYSGRFNGTYHVKDWLHVGNRINIIQTERIGIGENDVFGGVVSLATQLDPLFPVRDPAMDTIDGGAHRGWGQSSILSAEYVNPLGSLDIDNAKTVTQKVFGDVWIEAEIINGLKIKTDLFVEQSYVNYSNWEPHYIFTGTAQNQTSSVTKRVDQYPGIQWDNIITYDKSFGKHNIGAVLGMSARVNKANRLEATGTDMFLENENFAHIFATTSETQTATDQNTEDWNVMPREKRLMSYFGRLNYNYDERYLLTLIVRRDGSNKLASGNRFQTFPSVSAGWIISNENFWGVAPINFLKIRASWGQNGNIESLDYFQYVSLIEVGVWNYYFDDVLSTGAVPSTLSNRDLIWETSEQIDLGIDIRLLANRLSLSADYYDKRTKDLLVQASTPYLTGNNNPWINAGEVQNKGFEIEFRYNDMIGEFKYGVNINFATNKNEVLSYGNESGSINGVGYGVEGRQMTKFEVGYPIGYFYGFESDGIFQNEEEVLAHTTNGVVLQPRAEPGDVRFVDVNGDSLINDNDRTMIGNPHPKFLYGLGLDFEYKGFDLSLFFQGTAGNDIYNARRRYDVNNVNLEKWIYDERWHGEGTSNEFPRLYSGDPNGNWNRSDIMIEDASYLRLRDLRLGYTIPNKITEKAKISQLYFYVQGTNLLTFTKKSFHGSNPDIGAIWGNLGSGLDFGFYPAAKTYQIGAKITF